MFTATALFEAIKFLCDGRMNTMTLITTLEYRFPRLIVCKLTNGIDSMKVPRILSEISKCRATRKRTHRCGVLRHFSNHYGNPFKKRLETTSWRWNRPLKCFVLCTKQFSVCSKLICNMQYYKTSPCVCALVYSTTHNHSVRGPANHDIFKFHAVLSREHPANSGRSTVLELNKAEFLLTRLDLHFLWFVSKSVFGTCTFEPTWMNNARLNLPWSILNMFFRLAQFIQSRVWFIMGFKENDTTPQCEKKARICKLVNLSNELYYYTFWYQVWPGIILSLGVSWLTAWNSPPICIFHILVMCNKIGSFIFMWLPLVYFKWIHHCFYKIENSWPKRLWQKHRDASLKWCYLRNWRNDLCRSTAIYLG